MPRLQLTKSALGRERRQLDTFRRFLPSLDLKRQQLMVERKKAAAAKAGLEAEIEALRTRVARALPMLADTGVDLSGLVRVAVVEIGWQNALGTRLPVLGEVRIETRDYSPLARPHWVDAAVTWLRQMLELRIRVQIAARRVALLEEAVKTITQRVNLFDKVLIPRTQANVKRIKVHLSDAAMSAVTRSKIAKRKYAAARAP
jgi:V/A-type H+/Na+-transporting ATPase subunit D